MSRCCPLSLDIDEDLDALGPLCATELLSALVPHRARWEHLNLYLSLSRLDTIEGPMPLLQSLDLYTWAHQSLVSAGATATRNTYSTWRWYCDCLLLEMRLFWTVRRVVVDTYFTCGICLVM
jgi:hypothetical protein